MTLTGSSWLAASRRMQVSTTVTMIKSTAATTKGAARPKYWAMNPEKAGPMMQPNPEAVIVPAMVVSSPVVLANQVRAHVHTIP